MAIQNPAKARRTQEERKDQAIGALREAALGMLLEGGVASLTLGELGDRAGYSRGLVHYHFGSKEALLVDLLECLSITGRTTFEAVASDGLAAIVEILRRVEQNALENPVNTMARALLLNEAGASHSSTLSKVAADYNREVRSAFEGYLAGTAFTRVTGLSAAEGAILILSGLRGIQQQWLAERDSFDFVEALRSYSRAITRLDASMAAAS